MSISKRAPMASGAVLALALTGCSGTAAPTGSEAAAPTVPVTASPIAAPARAEATPAAPASGPPYTVAEDRDIVWFTDDEGD